ncbi:hypothetical protein T484DRAFT_1874532 [Baffinella frigidus]|nr:hypothetical protein T484DRAFT_1874532 [Cryptophyta sp. CCMP2293]
MFLTGAPLSAARSLVDLAGEQVLVKGLPSPRLAARAQEVMLTMIEAGGAPTLLPLLIAGMSHKVPKVAGLCVETVLAALEAFGPGVIDPALVLPASAAAFDSTLAPVRALAVPLARALVRRGGPAVRRSFDHLRAVQAKDLDAALADVQKDATGTTRNLRTEAGLAPSAGTEAGPSGGSGAKRAVSVGEDEGGADTTPVDVMAFLPRDTAAQLLKAGKWQDKKDLLDKLVSATDVPVIKPADFSELIKALRLLLGDSMVLLVASAIKVLGALGAGLGSGFRQEACSLGTVLLDKLKDKNRGVVDATHRTLDLFLLHSCSLDDLSDPLSNALGKASTPKVRMEALRIMSRSLASHGKRKAPADWWVTTAVLETMNDGSGDVPEQAFATVAPLIRVVGRATVLAKADELGLDPKRRKRLIASTEPA